MLVCTQSGRALWYIYVYRKSNNKTWLEQFIPQNTDDIENIISGLVYLYSLQPISLTVSTSMCSMCMCKCWPFCLVSVCLLSPWSNCLLSLEHHVRKHISGKVRPLYIDSELMIILTELNPNFGRKFNTGETNFFVFIFSH